MLKDIFGIRSVLLIFPFIIFGQIQLKAENLIESGKWIYFSDNVMGGISEGKSEYVTVPSGKAIRLYGNVSTENNGGFIQVRMPYSVTRADKYEGIKIKMKGNGTEYYLHIRNKSSRLPWQYYQASFKADMVWREIKISFKQFKKSSNFMRSTFDQSTMKTIAIVAYGKDHTADITVSGLEFY